MYKCSDIKTPSYSSTKTLRGIEGKEERKERKERNIGTEKKID
jgi:hypothetical protein